MTSFLTYFGSVGWTVAAFLVAIMVIVLIHELGHYWVGRLCGIKAETFSLGFGRVLVQRKDRHGTIWQIAALPLGGYVRFAGDANAASFGGDNQGRHTLTGAPIWARTLTVIAGPLANFVLSFLMFTGLLALLGGVVNPPTVKTVMALPPTLEQGLIPGDQFVAIDGTPVARAEEFSNSFNGYTAGDQLSIQVLRDGNLVTVAAPYPWTTLALTIPFDGAAADSGVEEGDYVLRLGDQPVQSFREMVDIVQSTNGAPLPIEVWRAGEILQFELSPRRVDEPQPDGSFETFWRIGIGGGWFFTLESTFLGLGEAMDGAFFRVWYLIRMSLKSAWAMITGDISTCNLSSPVGIAEAAGAMASAGLPEFLSLIAVLSTAIGFLNLLPIPMLDGGHLVFYLVEFVSRRKPGKVITQWLMTFGLALMLSLMLLALANDLVLCP